VEQVSAVSATLQSVGVALLAALLSLVARTLTAPYLRTWAAGWWALAAGLFALQLSFWWPAAAPALQPVYHLASYAFVAALAAGARRRAAPDAPTRWLPPAAWVLLAAVALGLRLVPGTFTERFFIHAALMASGFGLAAVAIARTPGDVSGALGRGIAVAALVLLAADFTLYPLVFGLGRLSGFDPPGVWAHFTSLYDLLLQIVLAFGLVVIGLQDASAQLRALRGLLPVCAWCRKLRDDQGYWSTLEGWVRANVRMDVTHGMCPDCYAKQFPDALTPP